MDTIKKLYELNIELEGILRVLEQRDSEEARNLLAQKFRIYSDSMSELLSSTLSEAAPSPRDPGSPTAESADTVGTVRATGNTATARPVQPAAPIKLDEMLSARQSADLRKAFTLNDKYRFRRELFNGSDSDFNHTIDLIVTMESYEEARDYLLRDLCWDPKDETVEDFTTIVKRHFQA